MRQSRFPIARRSAVRATVGAPAASHAPGLGSWHVAPSTCAHGAVEHEHEHDRAVVPTCAVAEPAAAAPSAADHRVWKSVLIW